MSPEPRSSETIFAMAIEIESPEDRTAFLERACEGNPLLRREVEELVTNHFSAGDFLEEPACGVTVSLDEPLGEKLGGRIGPYKLLEEIGEGGFGVVYMAEQEEPVRRRVALKVIKPGMDTRQVIARFEAERQALALMDHPNVARVLDAGATEGGRPYFVMDLIKGIPITEYADQVSLSTRQRLDLFLQVCHGVQHAHQKGIIHRDLKPSNVLVTLHDSRAVPKVIDFGVAKAIHHRLTERTLFTGYAQMIGTPLYMSPEQAALSGLDVDTRSDIYSLGVLLYELLTGTRPLEPNRLGETSYDEIRRVIREEEPPTPSERVATTEAKALEAIATRRQIEARKLTELLCGDLDWITMKALEKDRTGRYETASAFAADVERYLADEPVEARPASRWYRARKFARRNRAALAGASTVALALLLALGGVAGGVGWSLRERAERVARIGRDVEAALSESGKLREEAWSLSEQPARFEAKLAAASSVLQRAESLLGDAEGPVEAELPARMRTLKAELEADEKDRLMMATLDRIYRKKNAQLDFNQETFLYPKAIAEYREAFDRYGIRPGSTSPEDAAAVILARRGTARETLIAALDDWATEGSKEPEAEWLSFVLTAADKDEWRNAVRAARAAKDREALEALAERPEAARQPPASLGLLGGALVDLGASASAIALARRAQELHPGNPRVNLVLAKRLLGEGKWAEALTYYRIALALLPEDADAHQALGFVLFHQGDPAGAIARFHKAIDLEPDHALAHFNLGGVLAEQGDLAGAMDRFRKVIALEPDAASAHFNVGRVLAQQGDLTGAIASYRRAIEIKADDAEAHHKLGHALHQQGDLAGATASHRRAIELKPDDACAHTCLGKALALQGNLTGAIASYRRAIEIKADDAEAHDQLGVALSQQGDLAGAIASHRRAIELKPDDAEAHNNLGSTLAQQGDLAGAIASYRRAIELKPDFPQPHSNLGSVFQTTGDLAGAVASCQRAIEIKEDYVSAHRNLGSALLAQDDRAGAVASFRRAIELRPDLVPLHLGMDLALRVEGDPSGASAPERVARESPAAYKVYREALRLRPEHAGQPIPLYTAARLAALAAMAPDAEEIDPADRARLRAEAHDWLRGFLSLWQGRQSDPDPLTAFGSVFLDAWRSPYLASLRDPPEVEKLPGEEAARFRALWADLTRVAIGVLERLLERGDTAVEPELRKRRRWLLPDLATFASIDAAIERSRLVEIIPAGASWKYFEGRAEPSAGLEWTRADFDDGSWREGPSGFGYGDGDNQTALSGMKDAFSSVFLRKRFALGERERYARVFLEALIDDGCVAYLNGEEIARENAGPPGERQPFDAAAPRTEEPFYAPAVDITDRLLPGENVLAIQGLNAGLSSSDFTLLPVLFARLKNRDPDSGAFEAFRRAAREGGGAARAAYLDGRLLQLRDEHERALAEYEKAIGAGAPEPLVGAVECLRALGREAEAEARLRSALQGGPQRLDRLWLECEGRRGKSLEEILRGWPEGAKPPIELPPARDDASLRAVRLDLGSYFNRDVVADPGDGDNDFVDCDPTRLVVFSAQGSGLARGLPPERAIGVHRLGDYGGKNALQFSSESQESVRLEVPRGRYREIRFLVTGGHGDSAIPLRLEYADGRRVSAEIPCPDWFKDAGDGLPGGLVAAWNGMDFSLRDKLERAGDPALFEWTLAVEDAELVALELDPKAGRYWHAGTRFNLFAITAMAGGE